MDEIEAARALGMKPSEILAVMPSDDGDLVQTHDYNWTLIRADGELVFRVDGPGPDAVGALREGLEDVVDEAEAVAEEAASNPKPAPKRRGRS